MERIHDRFCIGKILIRKRKIWVVHITDEVTNLFALFYRDRCKVWFGYALPPAGNHVYGLSGGEIKEMKAKFSFSSCEHAGLVHFHLRCFKSRKNQCNSILKRKQKRGKRGILQSSLFLYTI